MEIKLESTYKGTRILFAETAKKKRSLINRMIEILESYGYQEMMIPIIQKTETFGGKVGGENQKMMYQFKDEGNRDLCLAPEYTAIVQQLTKERFKYQKDVKLFYIGECFRGERPQSGRYRQFTQFGVEVLNPSREFLEEMIEISSRLVQLSTSQFEVQKEVTRGLDYYIDGKGFQIFCPLLGGSGQIVGGGAYEGGVGFAVGLDRLLIL